MRMDGYIVCIRYGRPTTTDTALLWVPDVASAIWLRSSVGAGATAHWGADLTWIDAANPVAWANRAAEASALYHDTVSAFGEEVVKQNCASVRPFPPDAPITAMGCFVLAAKQLDLMGRTPAWRVLQHARDRLQSFIEGGPPEDAQYEDVTRALAALGAPPHASSALGWGGPPVDPLAAPAQRRVVPLTDETAVGESAAPVPTTLREPLDPEALRGHRKASWISRVTKKALSADSLNKARDRGHLPNARKVGAGSEWLYDVREVASHQLDYATKLLKALEAENGPTPDKPGPAKP